MTYNSYMAIHMFHDNENNNITTPNDYSNNDNNTYDNNGKRNYNNTHT